MNAARLGVAVEMDVRWILGGTPVVVHDATLDRTTNGAGNVADLSLEQLGAFRLDVGPGALEIAETVPTLRQALLAARDAGAQRYLVELKGEPTPDQVSKVLLTLEQLVPLGQVVVQSFSVEVLREVRRQCPEVARGFLTRQRVPVGEVAEVATHALLNVPLVTPEYVASLHAAGLQVQAWTANVPKEWERCADAGVDAVMTDRVREYLAWCQARSARG